MPNGSWRGDFPSVHGFFWDTNKYWKVLLLLYRAAHI